MAEFIPGDFAGCAIPYNDGVARNAGQIIQLIDGRAAYVAGLVNKAAGDDYGVVTEGLGDAPCASGVTASAGDAAFWDDSANTVVVAAAQGNAPANSFYLGLFADDKASGELTAKIWLNAKPAKRTFKSTYASGTWAVKTGFTSLLTYSITIYRSGVQLATNPTVSISGGTITIADTASGYTRTASDVAMIEATGLGI